MQQVEQAVNIRRFKKIADKKIGISSGFLAEYEGDIYMMKPSHIKHEPFDNSMDVYRELLLSGVFRYALGDRAPIVRCGLDKESEHVYVASQFIPNFNTLKAVMRIVGNKRVIKNAKGLEEILVMSLLFGDHDFNSGNIGIMEVADKYVYAKIDHGKSGGRFNTAYEISAELSGRLIKNLEDYCIYISKRRMLKAIARLDRIDIDEVRVIISDRIALLDSLGVCFKKTMKGFYRYYGGGNNARDNIEETLVDNIRTNRESLKQFARGMSLQMMGLHPFADFFVYWITRKMLIPLSAPEYCGELYIYYLNRNHKKFSKSKYAEYYNDSKKFLERHNNLKAGCKALSFRYLDGSTNIEDLPLAHIGHTQNVLKLSVLSSAKKSSIRALWVRSEDHNYAPIIHWLCNPTGVQSVDLEILKSLKKYEPKERGICYSEHGLKSVAECLVNSLYLNPVFKRNAIYLRQFLTVFDVCEAVPSLVAAMRYKNDKHDIYVRMSAELVCHAFACAEGSKSLITLPEFVRQICVLAWDRYELSRKVMCKAVVLECNSILRQKL